jgi:hypothetical protein
MSRVAILLCNIQLDCCKKVRKLSFMCCWKWLDFKINLVRVKHDFLRAGLHYGGEVHRS